MSTEEKQFKDQVTALCKELRWRFYVSGWKMHLHFHLDETKVAYGDHQVAAEIFVDESYLNFTITFYRMAFDAWKKGKIMEIIVHEFCHLLTEPLFYFGQHHIPEDAMPHFRMIRERQTELITSMLLHEPAKETIAPLKRLVPGPRKRRR